MDETEIKGYVKGLVQKYDYYDPIKDRTEALRFAKLKGNSILDIGTGRGFVAILAAKEFKCRITSIDLSEDKISIARENAKKEGVLDKITFRVADAGKIPFQNNSFDAVISFNALHHSKGNSEKIITEMFRVSKDKVVITELNELGAKIFDEYIHPEENHSSMALNLNELINSLKQNSKVNVLERRLMTTYVCEKSMRRDKR
ncbi:MAG: class I SAM-dependent methyltransferase [Nanoarchaeota archaeon]|nr:class I SAM-dependent methyltransferase [Nanoarchaeota archaeon]MBU1005732.1 class I SAM-dependent methyltransferase [Nanoarchaeota archaeon]MBU1945583.1 class I SAM-dependent methyltransferase [Nanoarchaeota archaeon]